MDGYHGTLLKNAQQIVESQTFKSSKKQNEWLGEGVYFFAYYDHAKWWISHARFQGRETGIIKAKLVYTDSQVLDLDDPYDFEQYRKFCYAFLNRVKKAGKSLFPKNASDVEKRCVFLNLFKKHNPTIGMIIYTFHVDSCASMYLTPTQRQICVSNHSIINHVEIV